MLHGVVQTTYVARSPQWVKHRGDENQIGSVPAGSMPSKMCSPSLSEGNTWDQNDLAISRFSFELLIHKQDIKILVHS